MPIDDKSSIGEFDLIKRFFSRHHPARGASDHSSDATSPLLLGVGDDCALLNPPPLGEVLAITSDMLVEGRHFFSNVDPKHLGHKSLAVNLSDLAAMGAQPEAFTLSFSLPKADATWLDKFAQGLYHLADLHHCKLIGGDTTSGPLNICITAFGRVPPQLALKRGAAMAEDDIWVSHVVGDARLALGHLLSHWTLTPEIFERASRRLDLPTPRIELGLALRGLAHAAIDLSDGLLGDLRHILKASKLNAEIWIDEVPISSDLAQSPEEIRRLCSLAGGDDYEICFTAPPKNRALIENIMHEIGLKLTRIGRILAVKQNDPTPEYAEKFGNFVLIDQHQQKLDRELCQFYLKSFDHFR